MNWLQKKINTRLFGSDLARMVEQNKVPDPAKSLWRLKTMGFNPGSIFDIGAYEGEFTKLCTAIWPDAKIHAFEGLPEKVILLNKKLDNKAVVINEVIVGESDNGDVKFFADETSSSVLYSDEVNTKKKIIHQKMISLDSYIDAKMIQAPGLLKIDTQGYEFPILQGCKKNLTSIEVLLIELNFIEVYHNVTLANEVISFLAGFDFVVYDICEIHRRPLDNALFQIDFLFVKKDSILRKDKRWDIAL